MGQTLRPGRHVCELPPGELGQIWRCDCGRRWVCSLNYAAALDGRAWRRPYWPAFLSRRSVR